MEILQGRTGKKVRKIDLTSGRGRVLIAWLPAVLPLTDLCFGVVGG